jgi:integrase/recombinase XerD
MTTRVTAAELARDAQEFLRFKHAMGISYRRAEFVLNSFVRFVASRWGVHGEVALDEAVARWVARVPGRKAVTVGNEFGVVRQLCLHRRRSDPTSYVPEHALAPVKESVFLPYIFTHDEVRRLLAAAASHKGRYIGSTMLRTLILVLYCTGMRLGEAVRLRVADVDLERGTLMVQHSKGRSRVLPIFLRLDASPLTVNAASGALRRLLRELGMKPPSGRTGARPYELRHAFAVHRLTAWAIAGTDIHAKLPWLSAYLGHQNVLGTEVYLKATPQLLELASSRFEAHLRRSRRPR